MCSMIIGDKEFFEWDEKELNRMVADKQLEKWGINPVY